MVSTNRFLHGRLRNRRRLSGCFSAGVFKPPGDFPKRKLVGFTLRNRETEKNRVAQCPPFPRNVHAAMLVELVPVNLILRRPSRIV